MRHVWATVLGIELAPFPRLRHQEAIAQYGLDKPDLRFGLALADVTAVFDGTEFAVFRSVAQSGGAIVALRYPGGAALSRRDFDALTETAKQFGAQGMVWVSLATDGHKSSASKFLRESDIAGMQAAVSAQRRRRPPALRRTSANSHMPSRGRCATRSGSAAACAIPSSSPLPG